MTASRRDDDHARFPAGPRPLGALVPRLTRPAFRRRSPTGAALMADWPAVVGPALAAVTAPRRLTNGTLTVACAGPVAMELTHLAPQLLARINGALGRVAVERLRFVQLAAPRGGGAGRAAGSGAPGASLPAPVEAALSDVPEGALRDALAKLARGVYRGGR